MLLAALPDGYAARVPTIGDAESVTDLTAECRFAVGDRSGMTVEELLGDWQDITLSEEAVAVEAPDGRYEDVRRAKSPKATLLAFLAESRTAGWDVGELRAEPVE